MRVFNYMYVGQQHRLDKAIVVNASSWGRGIIPSGMASRRAENRELSVRQIMQGTPRENYRGNFPTVVGGPGTGGNYRHILALPGTAKIGTAKI